MTSIPSATPTPTQELADSSLPFDLSLDTLLPPNQLGMMVPNTPVPIDEVSMLCPNTSVTWSPILMADWSPLTIPHVPQSPTTHGQATDVVTPPLQVTNTPPAVVITPPHAPALSLEPHLSPSPMSPTQDLSPADPGPLTPVLACDPLELKNSLLQIIQVTDLDKVEGMLKKCINPLISNKIEMLDM